MNMAIPAKHTPVTSKRTTDSKPMISIVFMLLGHFLSGANIVILINVDC